MSVGAQVIGVILHHAARIVMLSVGILRDDQVESEQQQERQSRAALRSQRQRTLASPMPTPPDSSGTIITR